MTACQIAHIKLDADGWATRDLARGAIARQLEADILPTFLIDRRWYGAKDAGIPIVRIEKAFELGSDDDPVMLVLEVTPPQQPSRKYLLPIMLNWDGIAEPSRIILAAVQAGPRRGTLVDAATEDRYLRLLLAGIAAGDESAHHGGSGIHFRRTAALPKGSLSAAVERSEFEQSNTSVRIGGTILKTFRKLESGPHPEIEVSGFLTARTRFRNLPAPLGSVEHVDASGNTTALCMLQALVPNQGDGWTYALAQMKRIVDGDVRANLVLLAHRLGQRTAELHLALATPTGDEAFTSEAVDELQLREWRVVVQDQARSVLAAVAQARPRLEPVLWADADRLIGRSQELMELIDCLMPVRIDTRRTRLHGDYHLGQVLISDGDVFIIDFEGEPLRPLAERRAKQFPLKDVAGMLRSFAYAGAAAERELPSHQRSAADLQLTELIRTMTTAFLSAYGQAIQGCPSHPADPAHAASLLRLFLLEKALYEVVYELTNRPDWLRIPLAGLLALLDQDEASIELPNAGLGSFPFPASQE